MKKIIKILQSNVEPLIIEDRDETNLNEYVQNLSKVLSVGHVTILETSDSSHIMRPQKIVSISVTEEGKPDKPKRKYTKKKIVKKEEPEIEDIITDE